MINKPPMDKMIRSGDTENKLMEKVKVKVARSFMYNGNFVKEGEEIEMNDERAYNHMKVNDLERDEAVIQKIKAKRQAEAEAALASAKEIW